MVVMDTPTLRPSSCCSSRKSARAALICSAVAMAHSCLGDCASYAVAMVKDVALLFKGQGFPHTDLVAAAAAR